MQYKISDIRYQIEHVILPEQFFENPVKMFVNLMQYHFVASLYDNVCKQTNIECPYEPKDFNVDGTAKGDIFILTLLMPTPNKSPECKRIHLGLNRNTQSVMYFTIEKNQSPIPETAKMNFLCGWTDDKRHLNYGLLEDNIEKEYERIAEIMEGK